MGVQDQEDAEKNCGAGEQACRQAGRYCHDRQADAAAASAHCSLLIVCEDSMTQPI